MANVSIFYSFLSFTDEFNIYTREAGGGDVSVSVEGPSKAEIDLIDRGDGFSTCAYKVSKEGKSVTINRLMNEMNQINNRTT